MSNQKVEEFYWRDYTNKIPRDAISVGSAYIGQAYVQDHGLSIVPIDPNSQFRAIVTGVPVVEKFYTKILCGDQNLMGWVRTTSTDFQRTLFKSKMVIGGLEENCLLGIGRTLDLSSSSYYLGKIMAKSCENVLIYIGSTYDQSKKEWLYSLKSTSKFDVCVYNDCKV